MSRRIGFVTTSWPSEKRPWAGHFIAGLAEALVGAGVTVEVVAPCFDDDLALVVPEGILVRPARVAGRRGKQLSRDWTAWLRVITSLRRVAKSVDVDFWFAHWWPSVLALGRARRVAIVLHGSDMDLLERLPGSVARFLHRRGRILAVAPGLASRFARTHKRLARNPAVVPLGAKSPESFEDLPAFAAQWATEKVPRLLTIARPSPGKGLDVARTIAASNEHYAYLVAGEPAIAPATARCLMKHADLCIVPSRQDASLPSEGRPHVIVQALVAGVPCVGGPNHAVRQAMREFGQLECTEDGPDALTRAIEKALEHQCYGKLQSRARELGDLLQWHIAVKHWLAHIP